MLLRAWLAKSVAALKENAAAVVEGISFFP
jgi:hypothetical protein